MKRRVDSKSISCQAHFRLSLFVLFSLSSLDKATRIVDELRLVAHYFCKVK
ncbi:AAEL001774-PA [Aedes aegypti]|uniref:AAEL001774-PA n=1 Tax=Aedes aegypti TaxID=7159 RepID=Q17K90_AEDAE|nr:AAEL001774-PA [Aedes aegypti]